MSVVCTITGLWSCLAVQDGTRQPHVYWQHSCIPAEYWGDVNTARVICHAEQGHEDWSSLFVYLYLYPYYDTLSSSALLAPAAGDEDTVHRQHQRAGPHPPGPHHQQELPVHVLEGDLSPHPGLAVRAVLLYRHLARLASVGPGQDCQAALTSLCRDILLSLQGPKRFREILTINASHLPKPFH